MSTKDEVQESYDVSNEFFELWLDEEMNYTCALFDGTDDLEEAQLKKLARLSRFANIGPETRSVLDIGCGWGANIAYQGTVNQIPRVVGITLSDAQARYCRSRGLPEGVEVQCVDYRAFEPPGGEKYDAVMSICMMEHISTPEQARSGEHIALYRDYFRKAWEWTNEGAWFGLQTIMRNRVPRNAKDLADLRHCTYTIFPGGISIRFEDIAQAVNPYWEIMDVRAMRLHYKRTIEHWRMRFYDHEATIRERWGDAVFDSYNWYLTTCIKAFELNWQSLNQWALRRLDF